MNDDFSLDDGQNPLLALFQQVVFEQNLSNKLNSVDILIGAIDDTTAKKVGSVAFKRHLRRNYLDNIEFMKKLRLYSKFNENIETAIEYYGRDYMSHPEFRFDQEFEKQVLELERKINDFIGKLLKLYTKTENITF